MQPQETVAGDNTGFEGSKTMPLEPLMNSKEMCAYLGICYRSLMRYIQEDPNFPVNWIGGWKAAPSDLRKWRENQPNTHAKVVELAKPRQGRATKASRRNTKPPGGWKVIIPD